MASCIPLWPHEVTKEWLAGAIAAEDAAVKGVDVESLGQIMSREGFLSTAFTAKVTIRRKAQGGQESREIVKLFVKIMPCGNEEDTFEHLSDTEVYRDLIAQTDLDLTEVGFYKNVLGDMVDYEESLLGKDHARLRGMIPRFFGGNSNREKGQGRGFYLILEDVSDKFKMVDFEAGLSLESVTSALKSLAHFHVVSMSFVKNKPEAVAEYDFLSEFFHDWHEKKEHQDWIDHKTALFLEDVKDDADIASNKDFFKDLGQKIGFRLADVFKEDIAKNPTLIHGDYWSNNLLFGPEGKIIIVDWQFLMKGSIFMDIALMACMSMSPEDTETNLDLFCDVYYDAFSEAASSSLDLKVPWTRNEFRNLVRTLSMYFCFMCAVNSYDLRERFPSTFAKRTAWLAKKCIADCPDFFTLGSDKEEERK